MNSKTEGELLELAMEAFALFHEAEKYRHSAFFFSWGAWHKIQSKAVSKAIDFELGYKNLHKPKKVEGEL